MKKFLINISLLATLSFGSCKKILEVDPVEFTSDDITIIDENSARTAVRGVYNQLASNGYYGYTFQTLGFFSGDNIQYTGSQTVNNQLTNHDVKADLAALSTAWTAIYNTINRANHVIEKVPSLAATPTLTQAVKDQLAGEAYFIRALSYFDLARTWGGVQLVLVPTKSASDRPIIPRSTQAATYNQVLSDLETAESLLPQTTNRIRATKKTVWALRARFHLYRQEWALAEEYATKLIDDAANYTLVQPYQNFFANSSSNTSESVLELYYSTAVTNNQASQWLPTTKGGVGWIKPTNQVVELLNDPAKGGNRNSLLQKVVLSGADNWFGNLYYRSDRTDPAFLIRIAEVVLNRAEARANQDKLEAALADLNKIRIRAGVQPIEGETDKTNLLLAIENERRLEFALENHRWYDLVRTNRAQAVLGITDSNKLLLPIPFRELLVDAQLQQNPGYGE
ncbi:RagB/SusD family nutrient uptake outer membrane protein [Flavihumibacter sp. UBA7668]|uniref:RagB/SusD family nutrient uptake outer membrane protein n=1 Tax=Flavihumibacter sp. UBA7668 TaxID=1946542 RepID=UPI0025C055F0|nr:RagB/SusD family nutrient uptake outer membrane protein [Flavihumibacter sp. UBA7668]